jgi:thiamine-phosphate pyrophosphorylase
MRARLRERRLYLCVPLVRDVALLVSEAIAGGVDIVQLREKEAPDRALLAGARELARLCRRRGVPFLVNDRPDIALAAEADGVHVGQDDLPAATVRSLAGPSAIVGLSTHAMEEFNAADPAADYLSVGPVEPTPTKPGRPGTGLAYVERANHALDPRPRFVTGNVTAERIEPLVAAGARHFVVVRAVTQAHDPREAATRLRRAIDTALAAHGG